MTFNSLKFTGLIIAVILVLAPTDANAQKKKKKGTPPKQEKKDGIKPLKFITEKCKVYDGLFPIYQDTSNGESYLMVTESQLNKDFLYFSQIADGVV